MAEQVNEEPAGSNTSQDAEKPRSPGSRALGRATRYVELLVVGIIGALTVAIGPDIWIWVKDLWTEDYSVTVQANVDDLLIEGLPVGQSYVTRADPAALPPPPNKSNDCLNRYVWSRSTEVQGADGGSTLFRVAVNAVAKDITIDGVNIFIREQRDPPTQGEAILLTCPGQGAPPVANVLTANLATGERPLFTPRGSDVPSDLLLPISRGSNEVINVSGLAPECDCTWLLELRIKLGSSSNADWITVGPNGWRNGRGPDNPDQLPFRTVSDLYIDRYVYVSGRWQPEVTQSVGTCGLIDQSQLAEYFGQAADSGVEPTPGYCTWAPRTGTSSNTLQLAVQQHASVLEARQAVDAWLHAAAQGDPRAINTEPEELPGIGDRTVYFGSFIYLLKGQTLYSLAANENASSEQLQRLKKLAASVANQLPG